MSLVFIVPLLWFCMHLQFSIQLSFGWCRVINSFWPLFKHFPSKPISMSITITLIFHYFLDSYAKSKYFPLISLSLILSLLSRGTAKSTIRQVHHFSLIITRSELGRPMVFYIIHIILLFWEFFFYPCDIWCFSTRVWVKTSLFKSPGLVLVFWPILTML